MNSQFESWLSQALISENEKQSLLNLGESLKKFELAFTPEEAIACIELKDAIEVDAKDAYQIQLSNEEILIVYRARAFTSTAMEQLLFLATTFDDKDAMEFALENIKSIETHIYAKATRMRNEFEAELEAITPELEFRYLPIFKSDDCWLVNGARIVRSGEGYKIAEETYYSIQEAFRAAATAEHQQHTSSKPRVLAEPVSVTQVHAEEADVKQTSKEVELDILNHYYNLAEKISDETTYFHYEMVIEHIGDKEPLEILHKLRNYKKKGAHYKKALEKLRVYVEEVALPKLEETYTGQQVENELPIIPVDEIEVTLAINEQSGEVAVFGSSLDEALDNAILQVQLRAEQIINNAVAKRDEVKQIAQSVISSGDLSLINNHMERDFPDITEALYRRFYQKTNSGCLVESKGIDCENDELIVMKSCRNPSKSMPVQQKHSFDQEGSMTHLKESLRKRFVQL